MAFAFLDPAFRFRLGDIEAADQSFHPRCKVLMLADEHSLRMTTQLLAPCWHFLVPSRECA